MPELAPVTPVHSTSPSIEALDASIDTARQATRRHDALGLYDVHRVSGAVKHEVMSDGAPNPALENPGGETTLRVDTSYDDGSRFVRAEHSRKTRDGLTKEYTAHYDDSDIDRRHGAFAKTRIITRDNEGKVVHYRTSEKPYIARRVAAGVGNVITAKAVELNHNYEQKKAA